MDYTIFYKKDVTSDIHIEADWDFFISAYNSSDRVKTVFDRMRARQKHWLIFPEYSYDGSLRLSDMSFYFDASDEAEYINKYFEDVRPDFVNSRFCIDITGFIRPYLMYLVRILFNKKVKSFDVIYSEPIRYTHSEQTRFSDESVRFVKQVSGYEGVSNVVSSSDLLIIGSGYDDKLIAKVADHKSTARKIQIFGLPSLQPDMFQENILRAYRASEAVGQPINAHDSNYYAPASDPFVTANVIKSIVKQERDRRGITNLYLSPLSTKAQTLGFCLYYLWECINTSTSIIYPYCRHYPQETSTGISHIKKFTVVLPG